MCGLVGMAGTLEYKHRQVMKELLFLNTLRGRDSTGLSVVKRNRDVLTRKMTVPGYEFIEYPVVDKAMGYGDQLWIGHNRFKTTGEVSRANAHPFEVLDEDGAVLLIGTHNGTLQNKWELQRKLDEKYDTDSETLFNWLAEAPNYKEAIKELEGAWSLTWWDATEDALHLCRNNERPMTYAYTKDRKVFIYASEAWMIINACRRNGLELETNQKGLSCYATNVDTLYTLAIPQEKDKPLPDLEKEGGYVGKPTRNFQRNAGWKNGRWQSWWDDLDENEKEAKKEAAKAAKEEKATCHERTAPQKSNIVLGGVRGFDGNLISTDEFDAIREKGCAWCKGVVEQGHIYAFLNESNLVCVRCLRDTHPKSPKEDPLDDELPFDPAENNKKYETLIGAAVTGAVKKVLG